MHDDAYTTYGNVWYLGSDTNPYILCIGANRDYTGGALAIQHGCKVFEQHAFYYRAVTSITLPDGLVCIWDSAFAGNDGLSGKSIFIPGSVLYMGQTIFMYSRGMSLTLDCAATYRPDGWSEYWNLKNNPIISATTYSTYWGQSR